MKTQNRTLRRLSITVPEVLYNQLTDAAYDDMTSTASIVRRAIAIHLRRRAEAMAR